MLFHLSRWHREKREAFGGKGGRPFKTRKRRTKEESTARSQKQDQNKAKAKPKSNGKSHPQTQKQTQIYFHRQTPGGRSGGNGKCLFRRDYYAFWVSRRSFWREKAVQIPTETKSRRAPSRGALRAFASGDKNKLRYSDERTCPSGLHEGG